LAGRLTEASSNLSETPRAVAVSRRKLASILACPCDFSQQEGDQAKRRESASISEGAWQDVVVTHRLVATDLLNRTPAENQTPHQAGISVSKIALNFGQRDGPQSRQWPSIDRSIHHQLITSPPTIPPHGLTRRPDRRRSEDRRPPAEGARFCSAIRGRAECRQS